MKTKLIPLIGDPKENLYQLGLAEKEAFLQLEDRVTKLLSTNSLFRQGQDILLRARALIRKKEFSFFDECLEAYAEGLGIDVTRYQSFVSLFEVAAHYGQIYPELKSIIPGCTSVFAKLDGDFTHSRLVDFPLIGIFEENPRIYFWQIEGKPSILNYSCAGMAPFFFQAIHSCGMSLAIHHKPGTDYHREGLGIFEIAFNVLFETATFSDFRKEIKKSESVTKWSFLLLDKSGKVEVMDIDGPTHSWESYNLNETTPLIFTNIPLKKEADGFESFIRFSVGRQNWLKEKLVKKSAWHILDTMTNVEAQKPTKWNPPCPTLASTAAVHVNLSQGHLDVKEGSGALVASDPLYRFSLDSQHKVSVLKAQEKVTEFQLAWKRASLAQGLYDQGQYDQAYHELQMAEALIPDPMWKEIFTFYLCIWDFRFISNNKELAHVYKKLRSTRVPPDLKDQWLLFSMRMERKLDLMITVHSKDLSEHMREAFEKERIANKTIFNAWMKLIYPRLEILDIFSPHHKQ